MWKTAHWRRSILFVVLASLACAALGWIGWRWTEARARADTDVAAATIAANHAGLLSSELEKFRLLPLVLVEYPDVAAALAGEGARDRLDRTLELLAGRTNAAVIYAIDRTGRTVAASNWRLPTSFVGQDYGFRPYFIDAMQRGSAELFALGTVSGRPGLYLSRRVVRDGRTLGVVVVKVEFDRVEAQWARTAGVSVATDRAGVVLVTSQPDWRFRAVGNPTATAMRTQRFRQTAPLRIPLTITGKDANAPGEPVGYRLARVASPLADGEVLHLAPIAPALTAARQQATLWALALLFVVALAGGAAWRSGERRRLQRAAQANLEREVAVRTAELSDANARLSVESAERLAADRRYRTAREELALASRLGSLGQITAGVAHEINQPVAAIRTFAENGAVLLDRAAPDRARENLGHIIALTDRIGAITGELRAFARRRRGTAGDTSVGEVIDGLLLLMGERVRGAMTIDAPAGVRDVRVIGDRIRLEQVLVNLTQNALDAVAGRERQLIHLGVAVSGERVAVRVSDDGPGVDPEVRDTLFTPFVTGRPDGLGLGLAIARDIAREFGGELALDDAPHLSGAGFVLTLRRSA
ncbi:sensor histidine kinase [Sphingomonas sp. Mn802worker]|uniref:sensor histidine kinase n=1 Tax=Sphingomonas sp. Mn802worker TaxID=629773 RepID=UPI00039ABA09|nr:ATP-binding protein [Sphingomonas sp. Mn802worker]